MNLKNVIYKIKKERAEKLQQYSVLIYEYDKDKINELQGYIDALDFTISTLSKVKEPIEKGVEQIIKECERKIEQKDYFLKNLNFHKLNKLKIYTILLAEKCAFQYILEYINKELKEKKND